jgi:hypothetical protein
VPKQKTDVVRILPAGMPTTRGENIYVNMFPEVVQNALTESKRVYCVKRRGLSSTYIDASAVASGEARGVFTWDALDYTYFVYGNTVYEYNGTTITARQVLTTTTGTVGFTDCVYGLKKYLFFCDGVSGYVIDKDTPTVVGYVGKDIIEEYLITNVGTGYADGTYAASFSGGGGTGAAAAYTVTSGAVSSINITARGSGYTSAPTISFPLGGGSGAVATIYLSTFPSPHVPIPEFMDGYLFLARANTSEVYNSILGVYESWVAGQYITTAQFAGDITALTKQQNYILAFKEASVEFLYNAGNTTGSPLERSQQAITQFGTNQRNTVQSLEDDIMFVGKGAGGGFGVWKMNGFKETKISTELVDVFLNEALGLFGNVDLSHDFLVANTVRVDGHSFYIISERGATKNQRALVYDPQEKFWSFWDSSSVAGTREFIGKYATTRFDKSHYQTNTFKILRFASTAVAGSYNDGGTIYYSFYNTPVIDMDNYYWKRFRSLTLVGDTYSYTNYAYINYSDTNLNGVDLLTSPLWQMNRISTVAHRLNALGSSRSRIWQVKHVDDMPFRFENLEIQYVQGVQ